jgi:tetratricopeptide (TPR) repeat protein
VAAAAFTKTIALAAVHGDDGARAAALDNLAQVHLECARFGDADQCVAEALAIYGPQDHFRGFSLTGQGMSLLLQGRWAAARRALEEAVTLLGPDMPSIRLFRAGFLAVAMGRGGEAEGAATLLDGCRESASVQAHHVFLDLCGLAGLGVGDPERLCAAAVQADPSGQAPADDPDVRVMLQIVRSDPAAAPEVLRVPDGGGWFEAPGAGRVSLARRRAPRRLLDALAGQAHDAPMTVDDMFEAGWPGEKASFESARHRVYVAVHQLRKLGLEGILVSDQEGYRLTCSVVRA